MLIMQRTPLEQVMIDVITSSDKPMTRKEIARELGRTSDTLNPYDVDVLRSLVDEGVIVEDKHRWGTVRFKYTYRKPD